MVARIDWQDIEEEKNVTFAELPFSITACGCARASEHMRSFLDSICGEQYSSVFTKK